MVSHLAEDRTRTLVVIDGIADLPVVTVGVSEMFHGVGLRPPAVGLVEDGERLLVQVDSGHEGTQFLVNKSEPVKGHAFGPEV